MDILNKLSIKLSNVDLELVGVTITKYINYGWEESDIDADTSLVSIHSENKELLLELELDLKNNFSGLSFEYGTVDNQDWTSSWKEFFTPLKLGKFIVLPPWLEGMDYEGYIPIIIEPKTAFGTGHHISTALCLESLSKLYDEGKIKAGMSFLDIGTGTGILGIAAAKLGLKGSGADIDILCVSNAEENKVLNNVSESFAVYRGSVENFEDEKADIVLANILAEPLRALADDIMDLVKADGHLVLSGILGKQAQSVADSYAKLGAPEIVYNGDWAGLTW